MDMLSTAMNIFGGYYETERGWRHYRVQGKTYDVQISPYDIRVGVFLSTYKFGRGKSTVNTSKRFSRIQNNSTKLKKFFHFSQIYTYILIER